MKKVLLCLFAVLTLLAGCDVLKSTNSLKSCKFAMKNVTDVSVAGINLTNKSKFSDISTTDVLKLGAAYLTKSFPLTFNVNVNVTNPNPTTAKLAGLDYIVWIDDVKMTSGSMNQSLTVAQNETAVMPLNFSIDLLEILKGQSKDKILSFGCGLATGNPDVSRVKVSFKPAFNIGGSIIKSPTYITIGGNKLMPSSN
ncbi:MAG: LEA type 2 family protein [Bacteroidales bacterium]|nr:LEA type 2 family protein [Bacteroidales bacterium]